MSQQLPVILASVAGAALIAVAVLRVRKSVSTRPVEDVSEQGPAHHPVVDAAFATDGATHDAARVDDVDQLLTGPAVGLPGTSQQEAPDDTVLELHSEPTSTDADVEPGLGPSPVADVAAAQQALAGSAPQTDESLPDALSPMAEDDAVTDATSAPASGRMRGLLQRLSRSKSAVGDSLTGLLDSATVDWDAVEDTLIMADFGVRPASELVSRLKQAAARNTNQAQARELLRAELLAAVESPASRQLKLAAPSASEQPQVVVVVGVNGTGKTTTTGKLARLLKAQGYSVVLAAADTFRAAAAEQLFTWGERVAAPVVRGNAGADPASVAFDALRVATEQRADVLLVDTAGRLHTKTGLMDELGKVIRILERQQPVTEVLLVLDATTGQNGLAQAKVFAEVAPVTGVVLTKLDGTAKGGIVVAVQRELGVPVKFVGLGEGPDDLADFDQADFVDALVGN